MTTVLQYLVIAAVIALVLFGLALLLFGRGEQMPPLAARTSPASLPAQDIEGDDVRTVKFSLAVRGYRMSDVDWTLDRLADELDRTRDRLRQLESGSTTTVVDSDEQLDATAPGADPTVERTASAERIISAASGSPDDLFAGDPPPPGNSPTQTAPTQTAPTQTPPTQTPQAVVDVRLDGIKDPAAADDLETTTDSDPRT